MEKTAKLYKYTAIFEPAEEGGYTVTVPSLPGCISEGGTFEEAMANIKEAASLYLEETEEQKSDEGNVSGLRFLSTTKISRRELLPIS